MALTTTVHAAIVGALTGSNDLGTPKFTSERSSNISLASGTASDQADLIFCDTRTIAASGTENLDLAGSLTDPLGATLTFATIKAILVRADAGNTNNVEVGGAGSNTLLGVFGDASDKVIVKPGGAFLWCAPETGATVTAGTGDILLMANSSSGTGVTYDIIIVGTSA